MLVDINMEDMDFSDTMGGGGGGAGRASSSTMQLNFNHQQARIEDITLKEDFGGGTFVAPQDDDFGDMGSFGMGGMDMDTFMMSDMERGRRVGATSMGGNEQGVDFFDDNSAFGANQIDNDSNAAAKNNDLNADLNTDHNQMDADVAAIPNKIGDFSSHLENPDNQLEDETLMQTTHDDGGGVGGGDDENTDIIGLTTVAPNVVPTLFDYQPTVMNNNNNNNETKKANLNEDDEALKKNQDDLNSELSEMLKDRNMDAPTTDAAATAKATGTTGVEKQKRAKRIRKLIIDDVKEIDSATMKSQLSDTTGILGSLELAPPTRQLMYMKENGVVDKLFSMTSRPMSSKLLQKVWINSFRFRYFLGL
jgi:cohesin complex subunit SCC1